MVDHPERVQGARGPSGVADAPPDPSRRQVRVRRRRRRRTVWSSLRVELSIFTSAVRRLGLSGLAFGLLIVVAVAPPFPFGSVDWAWITTWNVVIAIAAPFLAFDSLRPDHGRVLLGLGAVVVVLALYIVFQVTPLPGYVSENLLFTETRELLGRPIVGTPSISPTQTLTVAGAVGGAFLVFFASFIAGADARRARILILAVACAGAANAILGFVLHDMDPTRLFQREFRPPRGEPAGTFLNRNSAATLFAMCAAIFFVVFLSRVLGQRSSRRPDAAAQGQRSRRPTFGDVLMPALMMVVCAVAVIVTASRAGFAALGLGLSVGFGLVALRSIGAGKTLLTMVVVASVGAVVASELVTDRLDARFSHFAVDERFPAYRAMMQMIADHPWFGVGLGNFVFAFPRYRSTEMSSRLVWEYAHSTPLQIMSELGIPMGLIALSVPVAIIGLCIRGALIRRRDSEISAAGATAGIVGLAHTSVDFSLQIPGVYLPYAVVLGAAAAQSFRTTPNTAIETPATVQATTVSLSRADRP